MTRALGDTYMKEYISGHPFTTETILSNSSDEFMILACDGDVLVKYALEHFSTDNVSVMVVRFNKPSQSPQYESGSSPPGSSESPKE